MADPDTVAGDNADDTKGKGKSKKKDEPEPKKIELTEDELEAKIADARAAEKKKHDDAATAQKKKDDDESARQKGDVQKLYDSETAAHKETQAKLDAKELESRGKDVDLKLRDYLAEKHGDYLAAAKWIKPAIEFDIKTEDGELDKRVAKAVEAYVKDNPRAVQHGAPEHHKRNTTSSEKSDKKNDELPIPSYMSRA